jgi:hypothetical protein
VTGRISIWNDEEPGLVGVLRGDVDGSYAVAPDAQSLDINQPGYFIALIAAHTDLSASQFGVYP